MRDVYPREGPRRSEGLGSEEGSTRGDAKLDLKGGHRYGRSRADVAVEFSGDIAESGAIRVLKIRSEGKRNPRVEIALHDNPPT